MTLYFAALHLALASGSEVGILLLLWKILWTSVHSLPACLKPSWSGMRGAGEWCSFVTCGPCGPHWGITWRSTLTSTSREDY